MSKYSRVADGWRYKLGGLKTNVPPDALDPEHYPVALNVRAVGDTTLSTRPGMTQLFATGAQPITDMRTYAALSTDNLPRVLARSSDNKVWLDNGVSVGTLSGSSPGASMIPFRPAQSPTPYMYVAGGTDYQKFSAPSATNVVVKQNVGIAEPQTAPEACPGNFGFNDYTGVGGDWTPAGTGSAAASLTRVTDTAGVRRADPADPTAGDRVSLQVSNNIIYQAGMFLTSTSGIITLNGIVLDVPPAISSAQITIASIYYFVGSTGRCVVVPSQMPQAQTSEGYTTFVGGGAFDNQQLAFLRRGSLIKFSGGAEICLVLSVTVGPDGTICFETSTTGTHSATETITGVPTVVVANLVVSPGDTVTSPAISGSVTTGIATFTKTVNPFSATIIGGGGNIPKSLQPDDYIHLSVRVNTLANLVEGKILFDVGDTSFTQNYYYYSFRPSDLLAGISNVTTQLGVAQLVRQRALIDSGESNDAEGAFGQGKFEQTPRPIAQSAFNQGRTLSSLQTPGGNNQWAELMIPISSLTRVGNDQTKSLVNCNRVQVLFNASGALTIAFGSLWVGGGSQPDTGVSGSPYLYRARPRSSVTGAKGNPSPVTRYGVSPRRQYVTVTLPSAAYDSQIDTWDIFRYGGSVFSWRKIGSTPTTNTSFIDDYFDDAASAGDPLELDNHQPWPTVDLPLNVTASVVNGTTVLVTIPAPTTALRLLPGNLVLLGGVNVYTLWTRPTLVSGTTYLFQFLENAGTLTATPLSIYEPQIAQQRVPYMWGPDAAGTVFAVGDPLRPGTVYFAKNYAPDAAPDSYNIEVTDPSEPLLGGEVLDGLSFVASTERWWAMYPQPQNPVQRYSIIQQPLPRGLAAPYGHCNDGKSIYWWAKDGIWSSSKGSLTDADLYNLFPHEGVAGQVVSYGTFTIRPPDYSRASTFRIEHANNYVYATYQDSTGARHTLVYDARRGSWSLDEYGVPVTTVYHPEQQEGTVLGNTATYPMVLYGTSTGIVAKQSDLTNDLTIPIPGAVATMEWGGGDIRAMNQWGDMELDCVPAAATGLVVTPMSLGAQAAAATTLATSGRTQGLISLGGGLLVNFLGFLATWVDNFSTQAAPTMLSSWQPSYLDKPETIADRDTDWDGGPAVYYQGFILQCDTFNAVKGLRVRDSDALALHPFTPAVQHNGESIKAYSFVTPFIAHQVRIEPTDSIPWRMFDVKWVTEPTPEVAENWQTQGTAHGLTGYQHVKQVSVAYASTTPVTLTVTSYDGMSPIPVVLPSTGGAYRKTTVILSANKGMLFFYQLSATAPFQLFVPDIEVLVGQWGRQGDYVCYRSLGGNRGDKATI